MRITLRRQLGACNIDVCIQGSPHGITALYGPSGAGKTSILNMIAGLLRPDSGVISLQDFYLFDSNRSIDLPPERRHIGYIFQDARLFPHMSVRSNLLYGCHRAEGGQRLAHFDRVVDLLGIAPHLSRRPKTLSGGEKQRVALGRALLASPKLLLMDEPLASLDSDRKRELLPFIKELNAEFRIPVLYVSHVREEIQELDAAFIHLQDGRIFRE